MCTIHNSTARIWINDCWPVEHNCFTVHAFYVRQWAKKNVIPQHAHFNVNMTYTIRNFLLQLPTVAKKWHSFVTFQEFIYFLFLLFKKENYYFHTMFILLAKGNRALLISKITNILCLPIVLNTYYSCLVYNLEIHSFHNSHSSYSWNLLFTTLYRQVSNRYEDYIHWSAS